MKCISCGSSVRDTECLCEIKRLLGGILPVQISYTDALQTFSDGEQASCQERGRTIRYNCQKVLLLHFKKGFF
jgi:hypothetical protein